MEILVDLQNYPFANTLMYFVVCVAYMAVIFKVFCVVTSYNDVEQIKAGNIAVSMVSGFLLFSLASILYTAIMTNDFIWEVILWGAIGSLLLIISYKGYDLVTRNISVDRELQNGNVAVAIQVAAIFLALSTVIRGCIS